VLLEIRRGGTCFVVGRICVCNCRIPKAQRVKFMSNLCWKPGGEWKGLRDYEQLREIPSLGLNRLRGRKMVDWN
jgi:hypothetical protein